MRAVATIARRELSEALRSQWVLASGLTFALLALALSAFGMGSVGAAGFAGFSRTTISLLNLVLYLVPLLALLLSINSMASEREEGPLELLLAQPIWRSQVVLGKFCGLGGALALALIGGFSAAGLVIGLLGAADVGSYLALLARAVGLGLSFISLGLWIASSARSRLRALAWGFLLWFALVLLYDLLIIGVTALAGGTLLRPLFGALMVLNPVDAVRVGTLVQLGGDESFGLTAQALIGFLRGSAGVALLGAALLAWILVPLGGAIYTLKRRDS